LKDTHYDHDNPRQAAGVLGAQQLAGNYDTFLTLLTTQLKNQNPLHSARHQSVHPSSSSSSPPSSSRSI